VDELRRLTLDGFHHAWMTMASGDDGNSGCEIQEAVAVNVLNNCALTAVSD
jgi:hypothetical protein